MTLFVLVAALVVSGLMVGVELAVAGVLTPVLGDLPVGPRLVGRAAGARLLGRIMPSWYVGAIALAGACLVLTWGEPRARLFGSAAALFAASVLMSVVLLVPVNDRARTWTVDDAPADWEAQLRFWDAVHLARVAVVSAGYVLLAVGAVC